MDDGEKEFEDGDIDFDIPIAFLVNVLFTRSALLLFVVTAFLTGSTFVPPLGLVE